MPPPKNKNKKINSHETSIFPHIVQNILIIFIIQLFIRILWGGSWSYDLTILNKRTLKLNKKAVIFHFEFKHINCTLTFSFHFTKISILICLIQISYIIYVSLYFIAYYWYQYFSGDIRCILCRVIILWRTLPVGLNSGRSGATLRSWRSRGSC